MTAHSIPRYVHIVTHSVEFGLGAGVVASSIFFALTPGAFDSTTLGENVPAWLAVLWLSGYVAGGLGIMAGLAWPSIRVEFAGLLMLAGGLFANASAIILAVGGRGIGATCAYAGVGGGLLLRALVLYRLERRR